MKWLGAKRDQHDAVHITRVHCTHNVAHITSDIYVAVYQKAKLIYETYNVFGGMLNLAQSVNLHFITAVCCKPL